MSKPSPTTQYVLVESLQMFRLRYVVEVPDGNTEWAEDTVCMEQAVEFSQVDMGNMILGSRPISVEEVIALCDEDNDYAREWPTEKKIEVFSTPWREE